MSNTSVYFVTFILYFIIIASISVYATRYITNLSDFMLGGRHLSGPITALGAGASDMGGWLLLALPGAVFAYGLSEIWMPVGLSIGAYLNWRFVARRLRVYTEVANDAMTIPAFFDHRFNDNGSLLRGLSALVVLIFFTFYAAAGFVSGALLFKSSFDLSYTVALWSSAGLIMLYTAIGGFLAVNWIDFFQGSLMFFALIITPLVTFHHIGGWHVNHLTFADLRPGYLSPLKGMTAVGILSLLGWGLGYFGQPHILVRFMAVRSVKELPRALKICMIWMIVSLIGAIAVGVIGNIYYNGSLRYPESIFLDLAKSLFNPWVAGILLSAVLSAIMSTVSAQVLAASSALTADFYHKYFRKKASQSELIFISRLTVALIAIIAVLIALVPGGNILELVSYAWAGLGAAFGPVILLSLFWPRMTRLSAIGGIITGTITVITWKNFLIPLGGWFGLYELIPGFVIAALVIIVISLFDKEPDASITNQFKQTEKLLKESGA